MKKSWVINARTLGLLVGLSAVLAAAGSIYCAASWSKNLRRADAGRIHPGQTMADVVGILGRQPDHASDLVILPPSSPLRGHCDQEAMWRGPDVRIWVYFDHDSVVEVEVEDVDES